MTIDVDALAQEIRRVDGKHDLGAGQLAEALMPFLAALSKEVQASEAVAVKPLEWRNGYRAGTVTIYQASFGGLYQVRVIGDVIWLDWPDRGSSVFSTIEAAKAAAQADFEQRIRSALAQSTLVGEGKQP